MRTFFEPIAELRAFFASLRAPEPEFRAKPACPCSYCRRKDARLSERNEEPRKELGEGPFGARASGSKSRYRETIFVDLFPGRQPGGHFSPTIKPMPKPSFVESLRAAAVTADIQTLVKKVRIPEHCDADDFRRDLAAQALAEFYDGQGSRSAEQAFDRAERVFLKQYRVFQ